MAGVALSAGQHAAAVGTGGLAAVDGLVVAAPGPGDRLVADRTAVQQGAARRELPVRGVPGLAPGRLSGLAAACGSGPRSDPATQTPHRPFPARHWCSRRWFSARRCILSRTALNISPSVPAGQNYDPNTARDKRQITVHGVCIKSDPRSPHLTFTEQ